MTDKEIIIIDWAEERIRVTTGAIQRAFKMGYTEAAGYYKMLHDKGIIDNKGFVVDTDDDLK